MRAIVLAFALVVGGCAIVRNEVTAQKNAQFQGVHYRKVLVVGQFSDLRLQQVVEQEMAIRCTPSVNCVPSGDVFFPGKEYTPQERAEILRKGNFDAVILISLQSAGFDQIYIPQTSTTYMQGQTYGNQFSGSATTNQFGGFYANLPRASYRALLVDVATGEPAWIASIGAKGNVVARDDDLAGSVPAEVVDRLRKDGLFERGR